MIGLVGCPRCRVALNVVERGPLRRLLTEIHKKLDFLWLSNFRIQIEIEKLEGI